MEAIKLLNLAVRFLLELCILAVFSYWGFERGSTTFTKFLLGISSPTLFALVWGAFLAPKSSLRLQEPWLLILEIIIFGLATWALYNSGKTSLAYAFGLVYVLNKILLVIWRQS